MADGAGTPYCADEGYFSPTQLAHMDAVDRHELSFTKGHAPSCASLWQGKPCDCWKSRLTPADQPADS